MNGPADTRRAAITPVQRLKPSEEGPGTQSFLAQHLSPALDAAGFIGRCGGVSAQSCVTAGPTLPTARK